MKVLVVAPHPDDELIGCGGTLLKESRAGEEIGWLLVTSVKPGSGWTQEQILSRADKVDRVRKGLNIAKENHFELNIQTTEVDRLPVSTLVSKVSEVVNSFKPEVIMVPHAYDVHSDHRLIAAAVMACTKCFRYPYIKKIIAYETISETDYILNPNEQFHPNLYVNISDYLEEKLELLKIYDDEFGEHPFPRSLYGVKSQAVVRGLQSGFEFAEAFNLLRERVY